MRKRWLDGMAADGLARTRRRRLRRGLGCGLRATSGLGHGLPVDGTARAEAPRALIELGILSSL